jgi:DNA-3-methyladenine glycosylase
LTPPKLQQLQPQALRAARLGREWFARDAIVISRALLGCFLVHEGVPEGGREGADARDNGLRVSRIVETEAYRGPEDLACHARAGLTRRTRSLLGEEGHAYVFLVYGMHECFNVTCAGIGRGHAVLVRAGEPTFGFEAGARLDGPGRFAREMGISRRMDGSDLTAPPL